MSRVIDRCFMFAAIWLALGLGAQVFYVVWISTGHPDTYIFVAVTFLSLTCSSIWVATANIIQVVGRAGR